MQYFTTAQVAEKVGVSKKTIYLWLKKGVIPEPNRDYKNHRLWTDNDIDRCTDYKGSVIPAKTR
ncbi:MAG: MerR family DNA-binding transcriptional regulator [Acidobacteria bacterium]|nr:MerR family DNA-binding transcriptional regulator [Acidobacteriota bacterium]